MRAFRMREWLTDPVLTEVATPEPGPGQVLVRVGGAGVCHSDLHIIREFRPGQLPWSLPFTLGHETAGWVESVGDGVTGLEPGTPVAVYGPWGCGTCNQCLRGVETYCERPHEAPVRQGGAGLGLDGGMADYLLVPHARHVVPLPEGLDPVTAAPLTDAGLTPYHAVRRSWPKLTPTALAVIIGIGGLGHLAVQIVKATTAARVLAVDTRPEALETARRFGADLTAPPGDGVAELVREETEGRGADVVIDCVGSDRTLTLAASVGRVLGDLTIVGLGGGRLPVSFNSLPYEMSVQTTYWGSRSELVEVLSLARRGLLHTEVTRFPLDDVAEAYRRLEEGTLTGRAVVTP
ncbi:NAD(P)-dependent alcohol dehydrogenase [Saccharomonospora glauca]|jgi:propanol-preferring alcohol dehydrogenase|uniref:alcohol dehydrogenase n=1 Tax=Saccharomonospora glauca K62 TaxID=928724 RepID=I1D3I1_9PSEU|nr:NAD(P)-dependent alcohol dehydrogenase [Saccharomonospora glauca]EIE99505.1 Zn-dependent alcohol dehydrogenase [Saccharomonospora glauca K62]